MFGAEKIVKFRPMAVAIAAPLVIGLTVQAVGGSPAGAASDQVQKAALVAQETAAKRAPSATLSLLAAPVGQTARGKSGLTPGVATFRPARPGRAVTIQALHGSRWKTVVKGKQDRRGQLAFNVAATRGGTPVQFRAAAAKTKADPAVTGKPAQSANWAKSWGDEFVGSGALDPKRWHDRQVGPEYRLNRRLCSEVKKGAARRKGGSAVLEVRRIQNAKYAKKCKHGQYSNAMVIADSPESHLLYGFAAARVKFQANRGQHSAFWLQVPDNAPAVSGSGSASGAEIDVAEYFGDGRKKGGLASYVHWADAKGRDTSIGGEFNSRSMLPRGKEWSDAWHVYSVEWTPTRYVFRVDGIVTKVIRGGLSHRPEAVVLSALTSDWETPAMNARRFPTVTKYDWVRVWQQPNA